MKLRDPINKIKLKIGAIIITLLSSDLLIAKSTVCTLTMNSTNERELFEKYYGEEFEFVELTEKYRPQDSTAKEKDESWFPRACSDEHLSCDIIVLSGHFGGEFNGDRKGPILKLSTLRTFAFRRSCKSILEKSKEVYLFGCNTLTEKFNRNHGSKFTNYIDYYNHLMNEDFPADAARFIAESKFLPTGFTIREQMQMIFTGFKIIYGFTDVAPLGRDVSSNLKKFLDRKKNENCLNTACLDKIVTSIQNKEEAGNYWGKVFVDLIGLQFNADFGLGFSEQEEEGKYFIEARDLNWRYHTIPFKSQSASSSNWNPLFHSISQQIKSPFPLEMAPEVLYFFNQQLGPFLKNRQMTASMHNQLLDLKNDPSAQPFLTEMQDLLKLCNKTGAWPQLAHSIRRMFEILNY